MTRRRVFLRIAAAVLVATAGRPALADDPPSVLRVMLAEIPPYTVSHGSEGASGVVVRLLDAIAGRAGFAVDYIFQPWQRAQRSTQADPMAAIIPLTRTAAREPHYSWIVPLLNDPYVLVGVDPSLDLETLDGALELRVSALRASPGASLLETLGFSHLELVTAEYQGAKMLLHRRLDAMFARRLVVTDLYRRLGGDVRALRFGARIETEPMYLGAHPAFDPAIAARLRAAREALHAEGVLRQIRDRHDAAPGS